MTENMKSTGESIVVALNQLHPFLNHPFKVEQDEAFDALVESICNHGVLHRIIIRPRESGGYEIVAGHRRVEACRKLGLTEIIADLRRDMGNDQAILAMIDTNLKQRPNLLPSERARAYRMMRDTLKHQGKRIELNAKGTRATKEKIAQLYGDSGRKVSRFIRLTYLIPDLLDYVDRKKLKLGPAIQISFLEEDVQEWIAEDYVNAEDARILIEPLDITNKEKMKEQLARLGSNEAKAEAIQTRQVEVLESQRYVDPIRYMTFMESINKTIEEYLAERDSEKYLSSMEKMAEDYRTGRSTVKYPENIMNDGDAKSFYGAVCSGIKKSLGEREIPISDAMGTLSLDIKDIIVSHTKRDWRDNVIVHRNIKKALDDLLFDYMEEHELDWSLDTIDIIIDEIMMVAKKGY